MQKIILDTFFLAILLILAYNDRCINLIFLKVEYLPINSNELFIRNLNKRSLKRKLKRLPKGVTIKIINCKYNYSFKLKVK